MSGNFDYPPASSSTADSIDAPPPFPTTVSTIVPSLTGDAELPNLPGPLQQLRDVLRSEREQERADREAVELRQTPLPHMSSSESEPERRDRRAMMRGIAAMRAHEQSRRPVPTFQPPSLPRPATQTRMRATPSDRFLQHRQRMQRTNDGRYASSLTTLQQAGARLVEASSELRSLLDDPIRISSPDITAQEYMGEAEVNRRFKRRKLDSDAHSPEFSNVSYGHYGQVEPGLLRMEIVSCDGGNYAADSQGEDRRYRAENVLRDDMSVYSTKSSRCNLVLRQQGQMPFSLKKLVIKAPRTGYTAPVQEGMVFVSMDSDQLLARTTHCQIRYTSNPFRQSITGEGIPHLSQDRTTLVPDGADQHEYLDILRRRPRTSRRVPSRQGARSQEGFRDGVAQSRSALSEPSILDQQAATPHDQDEDDQNEVDETDVNINPTEIDVTAPTPPTFTVTTECTDDEDDSDQETAAERSQRLLFPVWDGSDDDEGEVSSATEETNWNGPETGDWERRLRSEARRRRRDTPSRIEMSMPSNENQRPPTESLSAATDNEILTPHARFFIKRDRSRCSVVFEPAVSGRFILLKLWSPAHGENIDIRAVSAHGFAGTRYFPAVTPR
ncbi:MAG: hypothetical protein M1833_001572 [Piccolia ochrophora]|nr:MAG: hypothetical protein M1833_001572 [Piccolia ochrophora]